MKVFSSLILSCTLIGFWSCSDSGEPKIEGCMDSTACNYSIENTHDDGSCWSPTEGCTCTNAEDAVADCAGVCGGDAVATDCGCDLAASNATTGCCADGLGPADEAQDCAGTCGGISVDDACGTCGGSITDENECDCDGGEVRDCAGVCGGDAILSGCDNVCNSTKVADCAGNCGGTAVIDDCGECGGDGSTCSNISYATTIKPIFTTNQLCTTCHTASFFSHENLMSVVEVADSSNSMLIKRLKGEIIPQMPKNKTPLEAQIITSIATWIQEGALDN